jgi:hypothetical protein
MLTQQFYLKQKVSFQCMHKCVHMYIGMYVRIGNFFNVGADELGLYFSSACKTRTVHLSRVH